MRVKSSFIPGFLLLTAVLIGSCRQDGARSYEGILGADAPVTSLKEADPKLYWELAFWAEALKKSGWDISAGDIYFYEGNGDSLGWEIRTDEEVREFWIAGKRDNYLASLEGQANSQTLLYHLPPSADRPPLIGPFAREWSRRQLLVWLVREMISRSGVEDGDLASYLAYRTTGEILKAELGPGSREWQDFRAEAHDDLVWAQLTADLTGQIAELKKRTDGDSSLDYEDLRERLYQSWLKDYTFRYDERFLTNRHLAFGKRILSDRELFALDLSPAVRPELDNRFAEAGDDLGALYRLANLPDAP